MSIVFIGLNPIDVAKIRMQIQTGSDRKYKSLTSAVRLIYVEEGYKGITKGLTPSMYRELTYSSIRIGAYEPIRSFFALSFYGNANNVTSPALKYFSALLSGGIGSALCNPFDLVKTRLQAVLPEQKSQYSSTFSAFVTICKQDGYSGLYRGWIVTSTRAAILTSAQIGSYDSIKNNLLIHHVEDGVLLHFLSSMIAGIITVTAINPVDVIKSRYMSAEIGKYKSPIDCVKCTYRNDGIKGFFKGWVPSYWRLGPHTVLSLLLIEKVRALLGHSSI